MSPQPDFIEAMQHNRVDAEYFLVTSLAIVVIPLESECDVLVVDGRPGEPVPDARVVLYHWQDEKSVKMDELTTDAEGYVHFQNLSLHDSDFLIATKDGEISFDTHSFYCYPPDRKKRQQGCFIYTDRNIYRPLQKTEKTRP